MIHSGADAAPVLTASARHHFLSPHYDDIALSCGGTVALLARAGLRPEISVTFGAEPEPGQPLSSFAIEMHRQWGLAAADVIGGRRQEEAAAAALLGATSSSLSFTDAIYRGTHYRDDLMLFGNVANAESTLSRTLTTELLATVADDAEGRIYAPLGIGRHVDHHICFATGLELAAGGREVWFYEDLPYALQPRARDERLNQIAAAWVTLAPPPLPEARLAPVARIDISTVWETKLAAIFAYASQVPAIFRRVAPDGSPAAIAAALHAYAMQAGDDFPGEQLWHLTGSEAASEDWSKRG